MPHSKAQLKNYAKLHVLEKTSTPLSETFDIKLNHLSLCALQINTYLFQNDVSIALSERIDHGHLHSLKAVFDAELIKAEEPKMHSTIAHRLFERRLIPDLFTGNVTNLLTRAIQHLDRVIAICASRDNAIDAINTLRCKREKQEMWRRECLQWIHAARLEPNSSKIIEELNTGLKVCEKSIIESQTRDITLMRTLITLYREGAQQVDLFGSLFGLMYVGNHPAHAGPAVVEDQHDIADAEAGAEAGAAGDTEPAATYRR